MNSINPYNMIARTFWDMYEDALKCGHSEYLIKGGRGSTKSSFISVLILMGLLLDRNANAIIYRRVGNTLKDSVYAQMIWAINQLELSKLFKYRVAPYEIELIQTGQRILFRGADDPMKSKSIKLTHGYFKYLWFEELSEFKGMEDIRTIKQSVFRGVEKAATFFSYNPPRSVDNWVNTESMLSVPNRMTHHSTYLDVPPDWLGAEFINEAEVLKIVNERAYRNEYLGEITGNGGSVFENVRVRDISDDEIESMQWYYQGVDWGYFPDPFQWVRCSYDGKNRILYIIDEFRANKKGNYETYQACKSKLKPSETLYADSAEPKSIADWREYGANWIRGVVKGPGSVDYSMKWLVSLKQIVIDQRRAPASAKEFVEYEYDRNNSGEFVSGYIDANNHAIDAVRYAMFPVWKRRGE